MYFFLQGLGDILVCIHFILSIFCSYVMTFGSTSSALTLCLGQNEVFFDFDYFETGGIVRNQVPCKNDSSYMKYLCMGSVTIVAIVSSNICEIYFNARVMLQMKTQSITSALTTHAIARRQRHVLIPNLFVIK